MSLQITIIMTENINYKLLYIDLILIDFEQELLVARNSMRRDADAGISPISTVAAIANTVPTSRLVHCVSSPQL